MRRWLAGTVDITVQASATTQAGAAQPGALVGSVQQGTPAARAGLRAGDIIVAVNGMTIASDGDLIDALAAARPGQHVKLTVLRGSNRISFAVTLAAQPTEAPTP